MPQVLILKQFVAERNDLGPRLSIIESLAGAAGGDVERQGKG